MIDVYGQQAEGWAEKGFCYSSQIDLEIIAPNANIISVMHEGVLPLGSLVDQADGGQFQYKSISIKTLISNSNSLHRTNGRITLQGAIVNDGLVDQFAGRNVGSGEMNQEYIHYVVLEKAAASITNGNLIDFQLSYVVQGNVVFFPIINDPLARNVKHANADGKNSKHWYNFWSNKKQNTNGLVNNQLRGAVQIGP